MNNIVTTDTNTEVVIVTAPGPVGPIGPQGVRGPTGTIQGNTGVNSTGSSIFSGSVTVIGSLFITGSNTFTNVGPAFFTGSTAVLGNFAVNGTSSATVFSGSGANLFDIPASGITGLNLSRIATANVSASVAEGGTSFTLNSGGTNLFTVSSTGLGTFANGLTVNGSTANFNNGISVNNASTTLNQGLTVNNGTTLNGGATINNGATLKGGTVISSSLDVEGTATLNGAAILTSATVSTNRITDSNISASVSATGKAFSVNNGATELASVDQQGAISGSGLNITSGVYDTVINTPNIRLEGNATLNGQPITAGDLTLNQIKSGAVTASVSTGTTSFTVESAGTNLLTISNTGAVTVSQSINIGKAEDGTYSDGLYTDITETTTVGTMIDRFNEVLKGLSPSPAPDLDNMLSSTNGSTSLLAFGATSPTASYSNVTGVTGLPAVGFTGQFGPSNSTRLGIFVTPVNISAVLNEDVPVNGSPFVNYPANAFNVPVEGGETYILEINGAQYTSSEASGTSALNKNGFNLSLAQTGSFPATGLPFNIFRHRTGVVTIPTAAWRNGWNYVRVTQGTNVTNFIDWVYDPAAAPGNFNYTFTGFQTGSVSPTGQKNLSGIKYYTGFSYRVTGTIGNFYKNVYTSTPRSFSGTNLSIGAVTINPPLNADSTVSVDSLHTFNGQRLLNATLASSLTIDNGSFGKSGGTGTITTPTILLDNVNTSNTTLQENFCLEDRRIPSASYDTQGDASSALGTFPSVDPLGSSDLAVYNGTLRYPTQVLNSGNVAGAGIVYAVADQPNYENVTQDRWFFRTFQNGGNAVANFNLGISGTNINFTNSGGTLSENAVKIWIKVPGKTGWRDVLTSAPGSTEGIKTNDNVGCLNGGAPSNITSQNSRTIGITLVTEGMSPSEYFVIRIQTSSGWTGTINQINLTGF